MENAKEYIDILISLEPVFKKAGELMLEMRKTAKAKNKYNTGIAGIDIVTEADDAVQEFILTEMIKTKLVECELVAEEDTDSVKKFKGTNGLMLTLDPIDGTIIYAGAGRFFSVMVCLNDGKNPLYTFCCYPAVDWSRRIANDAVIDFGDLPKAKVKEGLDLSKAIVHTHSDPEKFAPEIFHELTSKGYKFYKLSEVADEAGSCALFFLGQTAGYFTSRPNPYDGLCALHYGQAKKMQIYSTIDLSVYDTVDRGPHYLGWYLVLQKNEKI